MQKIFPFYVQLNLLYLVFIKQRVPMRMVAMQEVVCGVSHLTKAHHGVSMTMIQE